MQGSGRGCERNISLLGKALGVYLHGSFTECPCCARPCRAVLCMQSCTGAAIQTPPRESSIEVCTNPQHSPAVQEEQHTQGLGWRLPSKGIPLCERHCHKREVPSRKCWLLFVQFIYLLFSNCCFWHYWQDLICNPSPVALRFSSQNVRGNPKEAQFFLRFLTISIMHRRAKLMCALPYCFPS